jgi:hypothetical protein
MVEAALADHVGHVAILLVEEEAGLVDVGTEEGGSYQGDGHHFGGCEPNTWGSSKRRMAFKKSSHKQ